jgi:hypothetical protein
MNSTRYLEWRAAITTAIVIAMLLGLRFIRRWNWNGYVDLFQSSIASRCAAEANEPSGCRKRLT